MKKLFTALLVLFALSSQLTAVAQAVPELIYFKFNQTGTSVANDAQTATKLSTNGTIGGTLTQGGTGQFGGGLIGGTSNAASLVDANCLLNISGSWTLSMWLDGIVASTAIKYLFGTSTAVSSAGFRCFTGGAAGSGGFTVRGATGQTNLTISTGIFDAVGSPVVITVVYDAPANNMLVYRNGVLAGSQIQAGAVTVTTATNFLLCPTGVSGLIATTEKMDEFRLYNRALTTTEITNTWNQTLPLGPVCNAPAGLTATGITHSSANTSWGTVTGAMGYEYAVTTSSTAPATGTATTGTSYNAPGLTPATTYYLHVRTQCAASTFSSWTTYSFTTLACTAPTGLTSSGVTSNAATFNWGAATGTGYEYALTNNTTPPASGTATTNTSFNAISLTPNTNYCLHVRTQCGVGVYSSWVNTCITTLAPPPCPGPDTLNVTNITSATADLSWNGLAGAVGYQYAVTQSATPPATGTSTPNTIYNASGLSFATQYYAHVRAECSGGLFSAWKTKPFNTPVPPCDSPVATVSNITNESADISWAAVPHAQGYQVAVFSNPNPPNISGIPTTVTNYQASSLVSGKLYYVHLRTICSFDTSAWSSATFYTTIPASVSTVGSSTIAVYPNPVTDVLHIRLNSQPGQKTQIIMTDALGKELNRVVVSTKEFTIDMSHLPAGAYLLRYQDEEAISNIKVLKQ